MNDIDVESLIHDRLARPRYDIDCTPVHVVVAIVRKCNGTILISQRANHKVQGGLWEFPGGKVESGESRWEALCRELKEELDISLRSGFPLVAFRHDYDDISVFLDFWIVDHFSGNPRGCEGQLFDWVPLNELQRFPFPEANLPVIRSLGLPDGIWITPSEDIQQWSEHLNNSIFHNASGPVAVQFRAPNLSTTDYVSAARVLSVAWPNIRWIWNVNPRAWLDLPLGDVHLATRYLFGQDNLRMFRDGSPDGTRYIYAAVHNQAEYKMAVHLKVDAMVVSPIQRTSSHAGVEPIGWGGFASLAVGSSTPLYALGGVSPQDLPTIRSMGGRGWAGIRWIELCG